MHFINLSPGKVLHPPKPFPRKESNFDSVLKVAGMNMRKSGKRESENGSMELEAEARPAVPVKCGPHGQQAGKPAPRGRASAPSSSGAVGVSGCGVFAYDGGTGEAFTEFTLFTEILTTDKPRSKARGPKSKDQFVKRCTSAERRPRNRSQRVVQAKRLVTHHKKSYCTKLRQLAPNCTIERFFIFLFRGAGVGWLSEQIRT